MKYTYQCRFALHMTLDSTCDLVTSRWSTICQFNMMTFHNKLWYLVTFDDIWWFFGTKPCCLSWYVLTYHDFSPTNPQRGETDVVRCHLVTHPHTLSSVTESGHVKYMATPYFDFYMATWYVTCWALIYFTCLRVPLVFYMAPPCNTTESACWWARIFCIHLLKCKPAVYI